MADSSPSGGLNRRGRSDRRCRTGDRRLRADRYNSVSHVESLHHFFSVWLWHGRFAWLVRLAILIVIVQWGAVSVYHIPTRSMEPTLHGDDEWLYRDRVAVNKLAYGPRIPFTRTRLFHTGKPQRWDVVVVNHPAAPKDAPPLIKRVVGLPGEEVVVSNLGVRVNLKPLEIPADIAADAIFTGSLWVPEWRAGYRFLELAHFVLHGDPDDSEVIFRNSPAMYEIASNEVHRLAEELNALDLIDVASWNEERIMTTLGGLDVKPQVLLMIRKQLSDLASSIERPMFGTKKKGAVRRVPDGMYFLLGDNGPESIDSRYYGWVREEDFIGRAFATVYPLDRVRDLSGFTKRPGGLTILLLVVGGFLFWEAVPALLVFNWRVRGDGSAAGLRAGDCIWVWRWPLGVRAPGLHRWLTWRDRLEIGSNVLVSLDGRGYDLALGKVVESDGGETYVVALGSKENERIVTVTRHEVVGLPGRVWYPLGRRRKL